MRVAGDDAIFSKLALDIYEMACNPVSLLSMTLFLDEQQVRRHLRMADLVPAMEKALIDFSAGKVTQPVRSVIAVDPPGGFFGMMPALAEGLGIKLVTFYPTNAKLGIATHMATIFLVDPETGAPLAVMDGRLITEMRTAAVSAVATKLLASPGAKILAILGSGVQARSHVEALRLVRRFENVRVWSNTRAHAERFANEIGAKAMSAEDAVRDVRRVHADFQHTRGVVLILGRRHCSARDAVCDAEGANGDASHE